MGIIHRDIKLDNILFSSKEMKIKITDFTVSRANIGDETRLFDSDGTPAFTAPECHIVESTGYKPKPTDIWSFGVCLYTYISGKVPFYGEGELEMQINSRNKEVDIPSDFSPELKELLT
jgi:[calcium/calmodulin-dependent protein kinase] kinase